MPADGPTDAPCDVDVLVVGGGPAGLAAATWLGRHRRRTLVVDAGDHRNRRTEAVHGVLARDPVAPGRFREEALEDLTRYPHVELRPGQVATVEPVPGGFVADVDGVAVTASRVVLATGVRDQLPDVGGVDEHYGAGLQHCPTCEGFEARDRPVVVLGWGGHVPAFATELLDWASDVAIVCHGQQPDVTPGQLDLLREVGIVIVDEHVEGLVGTRGDLRAVRLRDGRELPAAMVFFSIGHRPNVELATTLGCELTHEGVVAVDEEQLTSVPGVYAAGDVTPGMQLVNVAVGQGTVAGVACARSLHGHPTAAGSPPAAPPIEPLAPDDHAGDPAADAEH